jgi:hypothetical protein
VYPSKIVIDHLNILLAPEVNKLLGYLSETGTEQVEQALVDCEPILINNQR